MMQSNEISKVIVTVKLEYRVLSSGDSVEIAFIWCG